MDKGALRTLLYIGAGLSAVIGVGGMFIGIVFAFRQAESSPIAADWATVLSLFFLFFSLLMSLICLALARLLKEDGN